jgi:hypothetical protein
MISLAENNVSTEKVLDGASDAAVILDLSRLIKSCFVDSALEK